MPMDWALLDFWVLNENQVKVFVVTQGQLQVETLSVSLQDADVQEALNDLANWLITGQGERDYALDLFYDRLFAPLMPLLRGVKGLYLVPHSYLHLIPLHACCIEESWYLCDEFSVAYLPSSSLLPQLSHFITSAASPPSIPTGTRSRFPVIKPRKPPIAPPRTVKKGVPSFLTKS